MTPSPPSPAFLEDVLLAVQDCPGLLVSRRRDLVSAVRRIAGLLDADPAHLPGSLVELRPRLNRVMPAAHGLSPKTWQNLRSNLTAAIKAAGGAGAPRRSRRSPAWQRLRALLPNKRMQNGLARFLTYCDREGVSPDQITDEIADRFARELINSTLVTNPQDLYRRVCRLWNEAVVAVDGWPQINLRLPDYRRPSTTVPLIDYPETFRQDLERYLNWQSGRDLFAKNPPPDTWKPRTIDLQRRLLTLAASALVTGGHARDEIRHLSDLVIPANVKQILRQYLPKDRGRIRVFAHSLATALITMAQRWVKVTPEYLAELKEIRRRLGKPPSGLTRKNRDLLRELADPAVRCRLFALPSTLARQATSNKLRPQRAATCFQLGLAVEILLHAPVRMHNLVSLQLDRNFYRPGGARALWHLVLPEEDVKNGEPLEFELSSDLTRMLDRYLQKFRPFLQPGCSQSLFIVQGGSQKSQTTLSQQLTKVIAQHVGIHMTPHQFRHFDAKLMLEHNPGAYAAVGHFLGHRNPKTTVSFYTGIDTMTAGRHFDAILTAERSRTQLLAKRSGRARQRAEDRWRPL